MKKILLLVLLIPSVIISQTNYYSKGNDDVTQTANWFTNTDGTGSNPPNFTTSNQIFNVQNGHSMTATNLWTVSGTGSKVVIKNGGKISTGGYSHSITLDMESGAEYQVDHTGYGNVTVGVWDNNSTIRFTNNGISFRTINHPSVIVNWSGSKSIGSGNTLTLLGDLTILSGTFNIGGTSGIATLNLGGSLVVNGGIFSTGSAEGNLNFTATGKSSGSINLVSGTLTLGTGTADAITINSSRNVTLSSNISVGSGSSFTVNGTLECGTNVISGSGGVTVSSGATLNIGHSNGINGNITTSGTNSFSTSANYLFNGSSSQSTGSNLPSTVNNLTIYNSSGVTLTNSTTVNGTLTLTSGNITTDSNNLIIGSSGSVSRSSGYVIGSLKKSLSSGTATFEVGTSNGYTPVSFANISGTGDFTVTTVSGKHPNAIGNNVLGMYWTLTNSGITSADLQFTYLDGDVTGTESNYAIGKYSGGEWSFPSTSLNTTNNTASTSNVTSFSDFTLGEPAALPVELNMFIAKVKNFSVQLIWSTATEVNNYGFDIERKCSNSDWKKIGFAQGYGNCNSPKNYSYTDQPLGDVTFKYRLKQIDFDGTFEYSPEIEVKLDEVKQFTLEQNYPNPFNPTTTIRFSLPFSTNVSINVFNLLGEKVDEVLNASLNSGFHEIIFDGSKLTSGIYFYQLKAGDFKATKKFIITK